MPRTAVTPKALHPMTGRDLANELAHFTGRISDLENVAVPETIRALDARTRLVRILKTRRILAHRVYGFAHSHPVVCFTEATEDGLRRLVAQSRYQAWGVVFRKNLVFARGGGPALYIRGDDWRDMEAALQERPTLASLAVRLWPGITDEANHDDPALLRNSQWAHEREWRLPSDPAHPYFAFEVQDIARVVVPSIEAFAALQHDLPAGALGAAEPVVIAPPDLGIVDLPLDDDELQYWAALEEFQREMLEDD